MTPDQLNPLQGSFTVNVENVLNYKNAPSYVRTTALILRDRPYETLGNIFEILSDSEIEQLVGVGEIIMSDSGGEHVENNTETYQMALLFTFLLLRAEGEVVMPDNDFLNMVLSRAMVLGAIESLHRKGALLANRKAYSLLDDRGVIASKLP